MINLYRYITYALIVFTLTACGSAQPAEAATKAQSIQFLLSQVRASGVALSGGKVDFYEAGGTTTRKTVWIDRNKVTQAANPYTLDSNGTAQLYGDGLYRIVIKDSAGVTKYDRDYISIKEVAGNVYDVADYASIAAAVASIGSTPATLQFASDVTVSANLVIPSTLELMPLNGAKINHGSYTISYAGSTARWPLVQIFNGTGTVSMTGKTLAPEYWGVSGNLISDDTAAVKSAFSAGINNTIRLAKSYLVTDSVLVLSGTTVLPSASTVVRFTPTADIGYGFYLNNKDDVTINALKIDCTDKVTRAIYINNGSRIKIDSPNITNPTGLAASNTAGIEAISVSDLTISNPRIDMNPSVVGVIAGARGIALTLCDKTRIDNPKITRTRGKFGDGIYTESCTNTTISNPDIYDFTRIGIVVEGNGTTLSSSVATTGGRIEYGHDNIGTEFNAGVWIESGKSDSSVIVTGMTLKDCGDFGVVGGNGALISNNYIYDNATGISGNHMHVKGNQIYSNRNIGLDFGDVPAGTHCSALGNDIFNNAGGGLNLQQTHGTYIIKGNTIKDNGISMTGVYPLVGYGIRINRFYNAQRVIIKGNSFISSMGQGAGAGQAYGIIGVLGGDYAFAPNLWEGNDFIFTGTFSGSYPATLAVVPCAAGYDNTTTMAAYELIERNLNSKVQSVYWDAHISANSGFPRLVGYGTTAPTTGTWRKGDYFLNTNVAAGGAYLFICTTDGTPGTWKAVNITP